MTLEQRTDDNAAQDSGPQDSARAPRPHPVRRRVFRALASVVALALSVVGGMYLREGLRFRSECRAAQGAHVLDVTLDVSQVGRHEIPLKQVASFACQQYVRLDPNLRAGDDAKRELEGLHIDFAVNNADGDDVVRREMPGPYDDLARQNGVLFETFTPMGKGDYTAVIDVTGAAPAMAGRPVRFVSGYILCGIEWMASTLGIGIGVACLIFALGIGAGLWMTRRGNTRAFGATRL